MITKQQYRRLMNEYQATGNVTESAMKADVSRPTARKYLEAGQTPAELQVKRSWRTRPDPLAQIWPKAEAMLLEAPGLEAKVLFEHFWSHAPREAGQKHLRTFQRRVKQWPAATWAGQGGVFCAGLDAWPRLTVGLDQRQRAGDHD